MPAKYSRDDKMMMKCIKCDTVLMFKETLYGYRMCKCGNLQVDNTDSKAYASQWEFVATKKDEQKKWRKII
ncbi:MAG: hypothetical protein ACR2O9_01380 [Alphaproteobacteria bacterium]